MLRFVLILNQDVNNFLIDLSFKDVDLLFFVTSLFYFPSSISWNKIFMTIVWIRISARTKRILSHLWQAFFQQYSFSLYWVFCWLSFGGDATENQVW